MCPTRHSNGGPRQGQCQGGGSVGSKSSPALPCAVRPGAAAPWGSGSSGPILPHSLCPCRGQLGTLGQDSAQGPGHGQEASERGDRALSPRTVAWPAGAEFSPGLAPGCAAHQRGHSQEQEGAGAWLHAGQDVPAQTKTPQKNRTVTPLQPHKGVPFPPTCACREVPAAELAPVCSWGWGRCNLDLAQLRLPERNRKPCADHTAIARFPALPPLPAGPPRSRLTPAHSPRAAGQPPAPAPLPAARHQGLAPSGFVPAGARAPSSPQLCCAATAEPPAAAQPRLAAASWGTSCSQAGVPRPQGGVTVTCKPRSSHFHFLRKLWGKVRRKVFLSCLPTAERCLGGHVEEHCNASARLCTECCCSPRARSVPVSLETVFPQHVSPAALQLCPAAHTHQPEPPLPVPSPAQDSVLRELHQQHPLHPLLQRHPALPQEQRGFRQLG